MSFIRDVFNNTLGCLAHLAMFGFIILGFVFWIFSDNFLWLVGGIVLSAILFGISRAFLKRG